MEESSDEFEPAELSYDYKFEDKITDLSQRLQQYCRENFLPIFNKRDTTAIIIDEFISFIDKSDESPVLSQKTKKKMENEELPSESVEEETFEKS